MNWLHTAMKNVWLRYVISTSMVIVTQTSLDAWQNLIWTDYLNIFILFRNKQFLFKTEDKTNYIDLIFSFDQNRHVIKNSNLMTLQCVNVIIAWINGVVQNLRKQCLIAIHVIHDLQIKFHNNNNNNNNNNHMCKNLSDDDRSFIHAYFKNNHSYIVVSFLTTLPSKSNINHMHTNLSENHSSIHVHRETTEV